MKYVVRSKACKASSDSGLMCGHTRNTTYVFMLCEHHFVANSKIIFLISGWQLLKYLMYKSLLLGEAAAATGGSSNNSKRESFTFITVN